ncbi:hypothetical protein GOP47_0011058 [Adiantum capillus-veneris]|uniref:Nudix hydrolase domain-containing protein n=1 Tax=Adiantum capillus-veneris TaxID=13818 RepID=A0A9D4ZH86_ADICA|nr:hypothetical protein GOP47_0011058 [Adiantum capillus-veneris]
MSTSAIHAAHLDSFSQNLPAADASLPNSGLGSGRSSFSGELSSHWNCSGRLSCDLHKEAKGHLRSLHDCELRHITCVHNLKDSKKSCHSEERVPPVFPINLSSCLRGWLSQLFHASANKEEEMQQVQVNGESQPGGFESFLLTYEAEERLDPLQNYIMHPFKCPGSFPAVYEELEGESITPRALAEVAINDLVSAIPSINALRTLPYFDMLHSNLTQAPHIPTGTSLDCLQKRQGRDSQREQLVSPDDLGSPDALALWLSDRMPSGISQWGTAPGTKRVSNLWIELKEGEILLEDARPPRRTVHVASVKIRNKAGLMLVEAHQEMADGSIRHRNRPLSEKMRPGENVEDACFRGIFEELGSQLGARNRVRILLGSYRRKQEERESLSYPGLLTSYVIHSVDAIIEDLPETGFYTIEDEMIGHGTMDSGVHLHQGPGIFCNGAAVGVKKHFWRVLSIAFSKTQRDFLFFHGVTIWDICNRVRADAVLWLFVRILGAYSVQLHFMSPRNDMGSRSTEVPSDFYPISPNARARILK